MIKSYIKKIISIFILSKLFFISIISGFIIIILVLLSSLVIPIGNINMGISYFQAENYFGLPVTTYKDKYTNINNIPKELLAIDGISNLSDSKKLSTINNLLTLSQNPEINGISNLLTYVGNDENNNNQKTLSELKISLSNVISDNNGINIKNNYLNVLNQEKTVKFDEIKNILVPMQNFTTIDEVNYKRIKDNLNKNNEEIKLLESRLKLNETENILDVVSKIEIQTRLESLYSENTTILDYRKLIEIIPYYEYNSFFYNNQGNINTETVFSDIKNEPSLKSEFLNKLRNNGIGRGGSISDENKRIVKILEDLKLEDNTLLEILTLFDKIECRATIINNNESNFIFYFNKNNLKIGTQEQKVNYFIEKETGIKSVNVGINNMRYNPSSNECYYPIRVLKKDDNNNYYFEENDIEDSKTNYIDNDFYEKQYYISFDTSSKYINNIKNIRYNGDTITNIIKDIIGNKNFIKTYFTIDTSSSKYYNKIENRGNVNQIIINPYIYLYSFIMSNKYSGKYEDIKLLDSEGDVFDFMYNYKKVEENYKKNNYDEKNISEIFFKTYIERTYENIYKLLPENKFFNYDWGNIFKDEYTGYEIQNFKVVNKDTLDDFFERKIYKLEQKFKENENIKRNDIIKFVKSKKYPIGEVMKYALINKDSNIYFSQKYENGLKGKKDSYYAKSVLNQIQVDKIEKMLGDSDIKIILGKNKYDTDNFNTDLELINLFINSTKTEHGIIEDKYKIAAGIIEDENGIKRNKLEIKKGLIDKSIDEEIEILKKNELIDNKKNKINKLNKLKENISILYIYHDKSFITPFSELVNYDKDEVKFIVGTNIEYSYISEKLFKEVLGKDIGELEYTDIANMINDMSNFKEEGDSNFLYFIDTKYGFFNKVLGNITILFKDQKIANNFNSIMFFNNYKIYQDGIVNLDKEMQNYNGGKNIVDYKNLGPFFNLFVKANMGNSYFYLYKKPIDTKPLNSYTSALSFYEKGNINSKLEMTRDFKCNTLNNNIHVVNCKAYMNYLIGLDAKSFFEEMDYVKDYNRYFNELGYGRSFGERRYEDENGNALLSFLIGSEYTNTGYIGECTWYVGIIKKWSYGGDGGMYCGKAYANGLDTISGNTLEGVEVGDLVSWQGGAYGHIGIVTEIIDREKGLFKTGEVNVSRKTWEDGVKVTTDGTAFNVSNELVNINELRWGKYDVGCFIKVNDKY